MWLVALCVVHVVLGQLGPPTLGATVFNPYPTANFNTVPFRSVQGEGVIAPPFPPPQPVPAAFRRGQPPPFRIHQILLNRHQLFLPNSYDYDYEFPTKDPGYDFLAASLYYQQQGCVYAPRWCGQGPELAGFYRYFPNPILYLALLPQIV